MGTSKRERQKHARQARRQAQVTQARRQSRVRMVVAIALAVLVALGVLAIFTADGDDTVETSGTGDATAGDTAAGDDGDTGGFTFGNAECPPDEGADERRTSFDSAPARCIREGLDYRALVSTSEGDVTIDLLEEQAPGTVNNFVFLARWNYYDGDDFHRVVPDFVVQGGDPVGDPPGTGGPGYQIEDELPDSVEAYEPGTVAMANAGPDTNGSQFFIYLGPDPLPGPDFSIFGTVVEGMDVVRAIEATATGSPEAGGQPTETVTIDDVTILEGPAG